LAIFTLTKVFTHFPIKEISKGLFSLLLKVIVCTSIKEIFYLKTNSKDITFIAPFYFS
jgi:hypothetical protein